MLRLATYYTPTHKDMCQRYVLDRLGPLVTDCVAWQYPQRCESGSFKAAGWNECMNDKLALLMGLPADGMPTLYVDADCLLLDGHDDYAMQVAEQLEPDGIAYSDDLIQWCAGVMVFRSTPAVRDWWRIVLDMSRILDLPDQETIAVLRGNAKRLPVPMTCMPGDKVANWGTLGHRSPWDGEQFAVPETAVIWHANWTIGVQAKAAMLERAATQCAAGKRR